VIYYRGDDLDDPWTVESYDRGTDCWTVKNVNDPRKIKNVPTRDSSDWHAPPDRSINRWDRFQSKRVAVGVWMSTADPGLQANINRLVDAFAAAEPPDYHPGTGGIVRDLVHPSLYPLIIDPNSVDTWKMNRWCRQYERSRFQWLPAEVAIDANGSAKFTSEINNLDMVKYAELTTVLEQTFSALLPGFEKVPKHIFIFSTLELNRSLWCQVWRYARKAVIREDMPNSGENYKKVAAVNFKNSNLQAVVKIVDYVFAPGTSFSGVWHYEGMAHENIVMTGLFYPASDERLGGGLEFKRQFTDVEAVRLLYGTGQERAPLVDSIISEGFVPLGYTTTETGKLMVFPNCHAHRVLEMVNNTQETLRRRLIVFFIVDPKRRIPSSKDFPPMPRKINLETALADRLELMQERKQAKQELNPREIELCEH
jgi:hypothetical protein